MHLGPIAAPYAFYLPNAPLIPENWHWQQDDAIAKLIVLNGNHWRKIFTIMAKICASGEDWRHYRDNLLLKNHEMLLIGANTLSANASLHLLCGQAVIKSLGLDIDDIHIAPRNQQLAKQQLMRDSQGKLQDVTAIVKAQYPYSKHVLLTPYLDYRQYSNALITLTRAHIQDAHL